MQWELAKYDCRKYKKLTQNELEQVFQVFSQWALEQEED